MANGGQADLAILLRVAEENTQALKAIQNDLKNIQQSADKAAPALEKTSNSVSNLIGKIAIGSEVARLFHAALSEAFNLIETGASSTLTLASNLEQAHIGFATMLGSAEAADQFIGQLQDYAESTAFSFPTIEKAAQNFLAMGMNAKQVLPVITDISNALSAAGHGGDMDMLQRVSQSLGEIQARGKLSGEQLRELSRDGIPILAMLTEGFHTSAAAVQQMSEQGQITSDVFFKLFHDYSVQHFGDIQAQQASTWAVASSNLTDVLGRLAVTATDELFKALTQVALALNDFLHEDAVRQWAADFNASIHVVIESLMPLWNLLREMMGLGAAQGPVFGPSPAEVQRAMAVADATHATAAAARDYKAELAAVDVQIHDVQAQQTALAEKQATVKQAAEDIRASYQAQIEPLKAQQQAIGRMAEDSKAMYDAAIKPLDEKLASIKAHAEQIKDSYGKQIDSLKGQVSEITKANDLLQRQYDIAFRIADVELRRRLMAAMGDPARAAELNARLQTLSDQRENISTQIQLLQLEDKKGSSKKAVAALQKQSDDLERQQLQIRQQLYAQVDHAQLEQVRKDQAILEAQKAQEQLAKDTAQIRTDAATNPLIARANDLELQQQKDLAPLVQQQRETEQQIATLKQQEEDAAAGFAKQQQAITRSIQDLETAQQNVLRPLQAQTTEYDRQNTALGLQVKNLEGTKKGIEDAQKAAATLASTVAQISDPSAGKKDDKGGAAGGAGGNKGPTGQSFFSPETAKNIKDAAQATTDFSKQVAAFFKSLEKDQQFVAFVQLWKDEWTFVTDLTQLLKDLATAVFPALGKAMDNAGKGPFLAHLQLLDKLVKDWDVLVRALDDAAQKGFPDVGKAIKDTLEQLQAWLRAFDEFTRLSQGGVFATIADGFRGIVNWIRDAITAVGQLQSALSGLSMPSFNFPTIPFGFGRAAGGPVLAGHGYVVGEEGPEYFVPGVSGTIVPNRGSMSGSRETGGMVFNFTLVNNATITTERQLDQVVSDVIGRSLRRGTFLVGA